MSNFVWRRAPSSLKGWDTQTITQAILASLDDSLRKKRYLGGTTLSGHCYVASEALYHLIPGRFKPMNVQHLGDSHWYLTDLETGAIVDLTGTQFEQPPDYTKGVGRGFLTRQPSKRAQIVIGRVLHEWSPQV